MAKWNQANLKNDLYFIKAVKSGLLTVTKKGVVTNVKTGNILGSKPLLKAGGYHRVCFSSNDKTKSIYLHRLVWLAYKGPIPKFLQVNHKNGDKSKNWLSNFTLSTNSENTTHAYRSLGKGDKSGSKHVLSKLTNSDVIKIKKAYGKGNTTQKKLAAKYSVSQNVIFNVVNDVSYTNV